MAGARRVIGGLRTAAARVRHVLDPSGRPQFYDLLRKRGEPIFYVFDILWLDGRDVRDVPLMKGKELLRSIVPEQPSVMLYARHVEHYRYPVLPASVRAGF
jgi:ATP-dependent DNA ligase